MDLLKVIFTTTTKGVRMNKLFLILSVALTPIPISCAEKKDVWQITKDYFVKNHPVLSQQIVDSFSNDDTVDDTAKLIMAFEALKYVLKNKGCHIPYSQEYMAYICSEEFKLLMARRLTNQ